MNESKIKEIALDLSKDLHRYVYEAIQFEYTITQKEMTDAIIKEFVARYGKNLNE